MSAASAKALRKSFGTSDISETSRCAVSAITNHEPGSTLAPVARARSSGVIALRQAMISSKKKPRASVAATTALDRTVAATTASSANRVGNRRPNSHRNRPAPDRARRVCLPLSSEDQGSALQARLDSWRSASALALKPPARPGPYEKSWINAAPRRSSEFAADRFGGEDLAASDLLARLTHPCFVPQGWSARRPRARFQAARRARRWRCGGGWRCSRACRRPRTPRVPRQPRAASPLRSREPERGHENPNGSARRARQRAEKPRHPSFPGSPPTRRRSPGPEPAERVRALTTTAHLLPSGRADRCCRATPAVGRSALETSCVNPLSGKRTSRRRGRLEEGGPGCTGQGAGAARIGTGGHIPRSPLATPSRRWRASAQGKE